MLACGKKNLHVLIFKRHKERITICFRDSLLMSFASEKSGRMLMSLSAVHEVIRRPGTGELHLTFFHLLHRGCVLVLIALHRLVVDQVSDIEEHLAGIHSPAGDLFGERKEHAMHLDRKRPRLGLTLTLAAGALAKAGQILLADGHIAKRVAGACVINEDLKVHLSFATKTFYIGQEMALVGTDGTP